MTADLDRALEPGETLAFRARGRSLARYPVFIAEAIVLPAFVISIYYRTAYVALPSPDFLSYWNTFLALPSPELLGGAVVFFCIGPLVGGIALASAWRGQRRSPDEIAITDRRILFANSDWDDKVETMPLSEVEHIAWSAKNGPGCLEVAGGGRTLEIPVMRQADAIAQALGKAAGKPSPLPVGRMAAVGSSMTGMVLVFLGVYLLLSSWFQSQGLIPPGGLAYLESSWRGLLFIKIALVTTVALDWLLLHALPDRLLIATVMRPFVTAEQMQAGLCARRHDTWQTRIALGWAGFLYRRRLRVPAR